MTMSNTLKLLSVKHVALLLVLVSAQRRCGRDLCGLHRQQRFEDMNADTEESALLEENALIPLLDVENDNTNTQLNKKNAHA